MITMQVIGNLGSDPEQKETQAGKIFCRFSIASNKKVKGEKITTWVNVTCFDERKTEFIMQYVTKGTKLFIEGEPQARAYEKDGEARSSLDCVLSFGSKVEICSSEPSDNGASNTARTSTAVSRQPAKPQEDTNEWLNDDIPF